MKATKVKVSSLILTVLIVTSSCFNENDSQNDLFEDSLIKRSMGWKPDFFYSEFIEIDTLDITQWDRKDFEKLDIAEQRMGLSISKDGTIHFYASSAEQVAISEKLYNFICDNYRNANTYIRRSRVNAPRILYSSPEGQNTYNNCVPISISNCCIASYERVVRQCNEEDPGWQTRGGVDLSHVASIMAHVGCQNINTFYNSSDIRSHFGNSIQNINGVLVYGTDCPPGYHAVNPYLYDGSGIFNKIFYNDNQNCLSNQWMIVSAVSYLFTCD